jgi:hypothetical protein
MLTDEHSRRRAQQPHPSRHKFCAGSSWLDSPVILEAIPNKKLFQSASEISVFANLIRVNRTI